MSRIGFVQSWFGDGLTELHVREMISGPTLAARLLPCLVLLMFDGRLQSTFSTFPFPMQVQS